jgi:hypothetical protein
VEDSEMDIYPELLAHASTSAVKSFVKDGGSLSEKVALAIRRVESQNKVTFSEQHIATTCRMANRATHGVLFQKDRYVKFELASPSKVKEAMKKMSTTSSTTTKTLVSVVPKIRPSGEMAATAKAPPAEKIEKKAELLPGAAARKANDLARNVTVRLSDLRECLNDNSDLPTEEIIALGVVLDAQRATRTLTNLLTAVFDDADMEKVASYTGMTPEKGHPIVDRMIRLLDAAEEYQRAIGS